MSDQVFHLLVVDDDERIRGLLQKFLIRNGFFVTTARDAAQARRLMMGLDFDMLVLDVMMAGEDGVAFTRDIRRTNTVPILLLTAKGEATHRIEGLEAGADDYLVKPFEPKELFLRINAILRRVPVVSDLSAQRPKVLRMGKVRYELDRSELWRGDAPIRLTATEAALMRIFAAQPGEAVHRDKLAGIEDGVAPTQDRSVDVQITRLRRKIEEDPKNPRYLITIRGEGYRLQPDLSD